MEVTRSRYVVSLLARAERWLLKSETRIRKDRRLALPQSFRTFGVQAGSNRRAGWTLSPCPSAGEFRSFGDKQRAGTLGGRHQRRPVSSLSQKMPRGGPAKSGKSTPAAAKIGHRFGPAGRGYRIAGCLGCLTRRYGGIYPHPGGKRNLKEKIAEPIVDLINRTNGLSNFPFIYEPTGKAGIKFLKMLMLREENPEVLLLKTAELFMELSRCAGKSHPSAPLALQVFAPFLKIIGHGSHAQHLEDLSFLNLNPREFKATESQTYDRFDIDKTLLLEELRTLAECLSEDLSFGHPKIDHRISWRHKGTYSAHKKRIVNDPLGIRVVVNSTRDCYTAQGKINQAMEQLGLRRLPECYDDYIARPKANGYRSLHETYDEPHKKWRVEIQIRSEEMDHNAEVGDGGHLKYKLARYGFDDVMLGAADAGERYAANRAQLIARRVVFALDADSGIHKIGPVIWSGKKPPF